MPRTAAGAVALIFGIVAFNVWRQGGTVALRSWLKKIFINRPDPPPAGVPARV